MDEMMRFLGALTRCPGISDNTIAALERDLGATLPVEYADFLRLTNGAEGFIGASCYVVFWRGEELLPHNRAYEVQKQASGLFLFGSNGGGDAYGFDTRTGWSVVQLPFIGMSWETADVVGQSFISFLERLHATT